ncbi:hypothetical protein MKW94_008911 [Papaver nudicaule]|uniref:Uncharacterized protein n=1 Tax=Papaver nudicaule TaxID=74823 RepID=A0AA41VQ90_PAPNU|nr:hypothetical protein [Papaver nudicaule]
MDLRHISRAQLETEIERKKSMLQTREKQRFSISKQRFFAVDCCHWILTTGEKSKRDSGKVQARQEEEWVIYRLGNSERENWKSRMARYSGSECWTELKKRNKGGDCCHGHCLRSLRTLFYSWKYCISNNGFVFEWKVLQGSR